MRAAVIHLSIHHQNTLRIAEAMARSLDAQLLSLDETHALAHTEWDLVGLGSGIFFSKHHRKLLEFAARCTRSCWRRIPAGCSNASLALFDVCSALTGSLVKSTVRHIYFWSSHLAGKLECKPILSS